MDFKNHYLALSAEDREKLANSTNTSVGMLTQVAYGHKKIELGFADVLVAKGAGQFGLGGLPLTDRAESQRRLREVPAIEDKANPSPDPKSTEAVQVAIQTPEEAAFVSAVRRQNGRHGKGKA